MIDPDLQEQMLKALSDARQEVAEGKVAGLAIIMADNLTDNVGLRFRVPASGRSSVWWTLIAGAEFLKQQLLGGSTTSDRDGLIPPTNVPGPKVQVN